MIAMTAARPVPDVEEWRNHPDFPAYEVSTEGRVRNAASRRIVGRSAGPRFAGSTDPHEYIRVTVTPTARPQRNLNRSVMVLETFVGPRPEGYEADHINHVTSDDRLVNLRWLPSEENGARKQTRA